MATAINYYKVTYPPKLAAMCKANLSIPGSPPCYSKGWGGTCTFWPQDNVAIDLYNDAEGFCLICVTYTIGPNPQLPAGPQDGTVFTLMSQSAYNALLKRYTALVTDGSNGLWTPAIWANRWNYSPGPVREYIPKYKDDEEPEGIPKRLFKYMKKEHAKALLCFGIIRIGTLYDYRKTEKYDVGIGDSGEGIKTIITNVDNLSDGSPQIPELFKNRIHLAGHVLPHVVFNETQYSPNLYLFCASSVHDTKLHKDLNTEVCVKIEPPERFLESLSGSLRPMATFLEFGKCRYMNKRFVSPDKREYNPAFIKEARPEFIRQREWRAIWVPKSETIEPLLVMSDVSRYCEIV